MKLLSIPCPKCGNFTLYYCAWQTVLNLLKNRDIHFCKTCKYEKKLEDIKAELFRP